jgi:uncharacterized protein
MTSKNHDQTSSESSTLTNSQSASPARRPGLTKAVEYVATRPVGFGLASIAIVGLGFFVGNYYDRYLQTRTLVLVAGTESGESYKLSKALEKVVENHQCHGNIFKQPCYNFKLKVIDTNGTDENLEVLEGRLSADNQKLGPETRQKIRAAGVSRADLATAQADVVANTVVQSSVPSAQTVAALYLDTVQLVVKNELIPEGSLSFRFSQLKDKTIDVKALGGQKTTFLAIAQHNEVASLGKKLELNFKFIDNAPVNNFCQSQADAIFRVRALGNANIKAALQCGQLVPIAQAAAMKIKYPTFQAETVIPEGAYQGGDAPRPAKEIKTIGIKRLLLARYDVPNSAIWAITQILNERRVELAENISASEAVEVKPLVTQISAPGLAENDTANSAGISLHQGARDFYKRNDPPFLTQHVQYFSALLTILSTVSVLLWRTHRHVKSERKNQADEYIELTVELMSQDPLLTELIEYRKRFETALPLHRKLIQQNNPKKSGQAALPIRKPELTKLIEAYKRLEDIFQRASEALQNEQISQESFRTFNEAYKTAREFLERSIEAAQRKQSEGYIKKCVELLDEKYQHHSPTGLLKELEKLLNQAKVDLIEDTTFSRESFRTFIETYTVVRDALDRRKSLPK